MTTRFVPLEGVLNFRDLGGIDTADGRRTRSGVLYRSGELTNATPTDLTRLTDLGVLTVLDLRSATEVAHAARDPLADSTIDVLHAPVLDGDQALSERPDARVGEHYLVGRYLQYLEDGSDAFARAFRLLAEPERYGVVINCFAGKDRTGVLSALVLTSLGVSGEDVAEDYALSAEPMTSLMNSLRAQPLYRDTIDRTDPEILSARASTMTSFLDAVEDRYGGVRAWLHHAGVGDETLGLVAEHLVA